MFNYSFKMNLLTIIVDIEIIENKCDKLGVKWYE